MTSLPKRLAVISPVWWFRVPDPRRDGKRSITIVEEAVWVTGGNTATQDRYHGPDQGHQGDQRVGGHVAPAVARRPRRVRAWLMASVSTP
jgi:hypothetical protein